MDELELLYLGRKPRPALIEGALLHWARLTGDEADPREFIRKLPDICPSITPYEISIVDREIYARLTSRASSCSVIKGNEHSRGVHVRRKLLD